MNTRKCPVCDGKLLGRRDQKYCSDACRYYANNESRPKKEVSIRTTNQALRKNRSILKSLCPEGTATVRRSVLLQLGFDARVFTGLFVSANKKVYYLNYDYGFSPILDKGIEKALIISRQPYMDAWDPWKRIRTDHRAPEKSPYHL